MGAGPDALYAQSSLTARRHAASNLPAFELPPPPSSLQFATQNVHRIPPLTTNVPQPAQTAGVTSLLTPPSNSASDVSSTSSGLAAHTPNNQSVPILPYTPTFWTGTTPTGFGTGFTPQPWQGGNPSFPRSIFSPSLGSLGRNNSHSPTAGESQVLPPPPYDLNAVPSFSNPLPSSSISATASNAAQHQSMSSISMHGLPRPPGQLSPVSASDVSKSIYGDTHSTGPNQQAYSYTGPSPSQNSQAQDHASRVSPPTSNGSIPPIQQHQPFIRPPPPSFSLPAMPGPVMANVNSPNGPMSLVGTVQSGMLPYHSGTVANPHNMYSSTLSKHTPQQTANDRPFRCDQCPQSFNRNHDLKRHKRIHLAVKPFPCRHCDKTFSRKDALKRHILVKGCGKGTVADSTIREDGGIKSDTSSDVASDSPVVNGQA